MGELASRLRRLETRLEACSPEQANTLRIDFAFAAIAMEAVQGDFGPFAFESVDAADAAIESAVADAFPNGLGVVLHELGESERSTVFDDGYFEDRVEALKIFNRDTHWTPQAVAAAKSASEASPDD